MTTTAPRRRLRVPLPAGVPLTVRLPPALALRFAWWLASQAWSPGSAH